MKLKTAPYEPLDEASDKNVTLKTVFLLALATAKRVGEIHGLSYIISHSLNWQKVYLSLDPAFVAKTQVPGRANTAPKPIEIPALTQVLDQGEEDLLLCPVRALKRYLRITRKVRPECSRLFVSSHKKVKKPISKNTISYWIRNVISDAYKRSHERDAEEVKVKAHEVRAIATSLLFKKNSSLTDVMEAASWRSQTTFSSFYLRDVTHKSLDLHTLGPVVAAQHQV